MSSPASPSAKAQIVVEVVGDSTLAGWSIVAEGCCVDSGGVGDGGVAEATVDAVERLLDLSAFPEAATYVSNRQARALLHRVYPNVILHPSAESVATGDQRLARAVAEEQLRRARGAATGATAKQRYRAQRKEDSKRRRYVANLLQPRLGVTAQIDLPEGGLVAGVAWLAEDGRHAVHAVSAGDPLTAEMMSLRYLLTAFNAGRRLLVTLPTHRAARLYARRKEIIAAARFRSPLGVCLSEIAELAEGRDIIVASGTTVGRLEATASRLAQFARRMHHSGGETPERWTEIDRILLDGIGFDRAAARQAKSTRGGPPDPGRDAD